MGAVVGSVVGREVSVEIKVSSLDVMTTREYSKYSVLSWPPKRKRKNKKKMKREKRERASAID